MCLKINNLMLSELVGLIKIYRYSNGLGYKGNDLFKKKIMVISGITRYVK